MRRRLFLLATAGLWGWRLHLLARHECAGGGLLMLVLRGEPWKLTERERQLVDLVIEKMTELQPEMLQRKMPKL